MRQVARLSPWFLLSFSLTLPAQAVDATTELLAQKGVITVEEYEKIRKAQNSQATVDMSDGLKISTGDKSFSAQIGTMLQLDAAGYSSDIKDTTGRDLTNAGSEFRRIRLSINGTLYNTWDYKTEVDFANAAVLTDGYATYRGFKTETPIQLTLGHFKIPFSQESLMADKGLTFMERSLPNTFLNPRAPGAMIAAGSDNWGSSLMLYGEQIATTASAVSDEGGGASWRSTWAPLIGPGATVHFGVSLALREPSQNNLASTTTPVTYTDSVRFRSKPESNIIETRLVDTGNIANVERTDLWGLELGASLKTFGFNAEYIDTTIHRKNNLDDLHFSGWYAQTTWNITGEQRTYKGDKGLFDGIKPIKSAGQGGIGAWELALRLSEVDLTDGDLVLRNSLLVPEVNGGKERNVTVALNWYVNPYLRSSINYVHGMDIESGSFEGRKLNALQMRFQLAY
ncbi:MAG: porin [Pseudomonadota bacterium]